MTSDEPCCDLPTDASKLADAMLELAKAIRTLSDSMPRAGLGGGYTVYHQHSHNPLSRDYGGYAGGYYGNT